LFYFTNDLILIVGWVAVVGNSTQFAPQSSITKIELNRYQNIKAVFHAAAIIKLG
jgi:hypothetical protein